MSRTFGCGNFLQRGIQLNAAAGANPAFPDDHQEKSLFQDETKRLD
jgi:hypothetical protein